MYAQNSSLRYSDTEGSSRQENIDGNPYFYPNWLKAEVIAASGKVYIEDQVNYNGYSKQIEYIDSLGKVREMIPGSYLKISFLTEGGRQSFMRGLHPEFDLDPVCLLYDGQSVDFIKRIRVSVEEYAALDNMTRKFYSAIDYFLLMNGRLNKITLKKKKILGVLKDQSSALDEYAGNNDLSLKSEAEIIQLLEYYEALK